MELATILISLFLIISQSDEVRRFSEYSNNLSIYEFVSVRCEGGLHDSGYSITFNEKVYFKQINGDDTIGSVCKNNE